MRCDLHAHSIHSGPADPPVLRRFAKECYSQPRDVYEVARRRGMDLVTLTDHDTITGALELAGLPGTFVSEEVTVTLPGGRLVHLGVFDVSEADHDRIAARRCDAESLFAYLAQRRIPAAVNHLFSALTGRREPGDFAIALDGVALVETRNGMMCPAANARAEAASRRAGLAAVGGSDAHTLASVANAYTVVPGASTREEFLDGLRRAYTIAAGRSGSYARMAADIARVFAGTVRDQARKAWSGSRPGARAALLLSGVPLAALIPVAAGYLYARDHLFAIRHFRRLETARLAVVHEVPAPGPLGPAATTRPAAAR